MNFPPRLPFSDLKRHPKRLLSCLRTLFLAAAAMACAHSALAVLGQPLSAGATAGTSNPTAFKSAAVTTSSSYTSSSTTTFNHYTVRKTVQDNGTTISEYANSSGVVFAVAWQGHSMPDLGPLLGSYFSGFKAQADATRNTRNIGTPVNISTDTVVVHSGGRMRNFSGNAYVPALVPSGVTISDVLP